MKQPELLPCAICDRVNLPARSHFACDSCGAARIDRLHTVPYGTFYRRGSSPHPHLHLCDVCMESAGDSHVRGHIGAALRQ